MKNKILLFFLFQLLFLSGQTKTDSIAIKVFLEDAYTGKNIKDAKVTLEGFEIPEIVGKYDKKGKFYYFTEIPEGYNTVMTYHEKYNEKGFQNIDKLPSQLNFKLYKPKHIERIQYLPFCRNYPCKIVYMEDPYLISIASPHSYNEFIPYITDFIKKNDLEIELVNPYFESSVNTYLEFKELKVVEELEEFKKENNNGYPFIKDYEKYLLEGREVSLSGNILPMDDGRSSGFPEMHEPSAKVCFLFRKKDGATFKRFNDPIINKIRNLKEAKFDVASVVLQKSYFYEKEMDKMNKKYNKKIDSSKTFFYYNKYEIKPRSSKIVNLFKKKNNNNSNEQINIEECDYLNADFFLIYPNAEDPFNLFQNRCEEGGSKNEIQKDNISNGIGLGILDMFENYIK